jgi:pilus assembly protein Flp/PilA
MQREEIHMFTLVQSLFEWLQSRDERGATAVEYGMIVALIAAIIVGVVTTVGGQVESAFNSLVGQF